MLDGTMKETFDEIVEIVRNGDLQGTYTQDLLARAGIIIADLSVKLEMEKIKNIEKKELTD